MCHDGTGFPEDSLKKQQHDMKCYCCLSRPTEVLATEDPAGLNSESVCGLTTMALIYTACLSAAASGAIESI